MTETDWTTLGFLFGVVVFALAIIIHVLDNDDFDGGW
jgi:hypothetical protein